MRMHTRYLGGLLVALVAVSGVSAAAGDPELVRAVKERQQATVSSLLQRGVDVNQPEADGTTALHWTVYWNDVKTADLLIRAGANVNAANRYGATPLWMASSEGKVEMVAALLKAGADPNRTALGGEPVIHSAARAGNVDVIRALLAHGANVNAKESRHGQTALMWAVGGLDRHPEVVKMFLEVGADVAIRSDGGLTALLFAVRQGDLESVRLMLNGGADVNDRAVPADRRPVMILGSSNWTMPSADTSPALTLAIINQYYDLAMLLLENGADPNASPEPWPFGSKPSVAVSGEALKPGFTPLHAVVYSRVRLRDPLKNEQSVALMKALIARGAAINARTPSLKAPVPLQVSPQPQITFVEVGGVTPFWIAANAMDTEVMRLLVAAGADPKLASMENTTPLMVAAGLGMNTRGPSGGLGRRGGVNTEGVEALKLLLEWGNDINAVNANGQTALHAAAFAAAHVAVQILIDQGARTDLKDSMGRRPLEVAVDNTRDEYRPSLQNFNPVDIDQTITLLRKLTKPTPADF